MDRYSIPMLAWSGHDDRTNLLQEDQKYNNQSSEAPVTLSIWRHSRVKVVFATVAALLFAGLLSFGFYLTVHPQFLPSVGYIGSPKVSLKTYNILISIGGNLAGALCGMVVAHGVRAWTTRQLRYGTLSLGTYSSLVHFSNNSLVQNPKAWGAVLLSLLIFVTTNQVSTAVIGAFGAIPAIQEYPYNITLLDIDPNGGLALGGVNAFNPSGNGPAEYEGALKSLIDLVATGSNPFDEYYASEEGVISPLGFGLNTFPAGVGTYLKEGPASLMNLNTTNTEFLRNLNATQDYKMGFVAPALSLNAVCTNSTTTGISSVRQTSTGKSYNEYTLSGYCDDQVVPLAVDSDRSQIFYIFPTVCAIPAHNSSVPSLIWMTYYFLNPSNGGLGSHAVYECSVEMFLSTSVLAIEQTPLRAAILDLEQSNFTAGFDTNNLVASVINNEWSRNVGAYGSAGLAELLYIWELIYEVEKIPTKLSDVFTSASLALVGVSATHLYNDVTADYGGGQYNGTGSSFNTTLYFFLPVLKIGAQGEKAAVLVIFIICLLLSFASIIVQLLQPHWTFDPLDPAGVLIAAQNSPMSSVVDGGCAGEISNISDPNATVRYGVLWTAREPGHLGFSWDGRVTKEPVESVAYA